MAYYEANSRFKHLVEDVGEMFWGWYENTAESNEDTAEKEEGDQHCLLERMLRVSLFAVISFSVLSRM